MSAGKANGEVRRPASAATNLMGMPEVHNSKSRCMLTQTLAGGAAGMMEALVCHPLGMFYFFIFSCSIDTWSNNLTRA